ncbi:MAG TPA: hypothetical protein ENG31_03475 [Candidatus Thorarchaeota archaeon]|nr:hypothetical protein [Candidatus Thorarchaeota archaeon]
MKRWLMDILACPDPECRSELELEVFALHEETSEDGTTYEEIDEALITCPNCGRWYPVIDGIACLLPDEHRITGKQRIEETAFLERWKDRIDAKTINSGRPFGLNSTHDTVSAS